MKEELKCILIGGISAALGGGLSFLFTRAHYQKKYKKEINDISSAMAKLTEKQQKAELLHNEEKKEYEEVIENFKAKAKDALEVKLQEVKEAIRVVPEEEFLKSDYDICYLSYYEDGIITDNRDLPVEHPESILGPFYDDFFANRLGGIVHVLNDDLKQKFSVDICGEPYSDDFSIPEVGGVFPTDDDEDEDY